MAPRRVGIAGYMGAGKSTAARLLAQGGGTIIDADRAAKTLMQESLPIRSRLKETFGPGVLERGEIRFDLLGQAAFASETSILKLNEIVHPQLVNFLRKYLSEFHGKTLILDAALLPLWRLETLFDTCLWVHAPPELRVRRILSRRSGLGEAEIRERMRLQEGVLPQPVSLNPWKIVNNVGSPEQLEEIIDLFLR